MMKIISYCLIFLSVIAYPIGLVVGFYVNDITFFAEFSALNNWASIIFIVFPIASLVFGIILKSKKLKTKSNIVVGSIFSLIILVSGIVSYSIRIDETTNLLRAIENNTGVVMPKDAKVKIWNNSKFKVGYVKIMSMYEKQSFRQIVDHSDTWISHLPNVSQQIVSSLFKKEVFDKSFLYIYTNDIGFNPQVLEPGQYEIAYCTYDISIGRLFVVDSYITEWNYLL